MLPGRTAPLLTFLFLPLLAQSALAQTESKLDIGITGYTGSNLPPHLDPFAVTAEPSVQNLIIAIAAQPRDSAFVDNALRGGRFNKFQLEELGVVRLKDGLYHLGFTYFTKADTDLLMDVSTRFAKSLTAQLKKSWGDFDSTLSSYPVKSVDKRDLAFFLLGCVSLDWDGLALTSELGLRVLDKPQANNGRYLLWGSEKGGKTFKGMYWGSHYTEAGNSVLITFGDHHSLPRQGFPDINGRFVRGLVSSSEDAQMKTALRGVGVDLAMQLAQWSGEAMLELRRSGASTPRQLAPKLGWTDSRTQNVLNTLVALKYVDKEGERYSAAIPVLVEADRDLVTATEAFGRQAMRAWLADNYDAIKSELSGLTSVRHGVPYEEVFSQVWHFLFGATNRELAAQGLIRDPYGPESKFVGFVPVVSAAGVAQRN